MKFWKWNRNNPADKKPITLKIQIKTPKGQAKKTAHKISMFVLGLRKNEYEKLKTNPDDSIIIWTVKVPLKKAIDINKKVLWFEQMVRGVFERKVVQKAIKKKFSKEEVKEVKEMLTKNTRVKILKEGETQWD